MIDKSFQIYIQFLNYWKMHLWNFPTLGMIWSLIPHVEQPPKICPPSAMKSIYKKVPPCFEQLKGKILASITPERLHFVEEINQSLYKKSFDLTKKRHVRKFDELISKNKVTQSANPITDNS